MEDSIIFLFFLKKVILYSLMIWRGKGSAAKKNVTNIIIKVFQVVI